MHDQTFYVYDISSQDEPKLLKLMSILRKNTKLSLHGGLTEYHMFKDRLLEHMARRANDFLRHKFIEHCSTHGMRMTKSFREQWNSFKVRFGGTKASDIAIHDTASIQQQSMQYTSGVEGLPSQPAVNLQETPQRGKSPTCQKSHLFYVLLLCKKSSLAIFVVKQSII